MLETMSIAKRIKSRGDREEIMMASKSTLTGTCICEDKIGNVCGSP